MQTAKVLNDGKNQIAILPKGFQFEDDEVVVQKVGRSLILVPKDDLWQTFLERMDSFTDDIFKDGRQQGQQGERDW